MDVREPSRAPEVGVRPRALRGGDRRVERRARPVRDDQEVRAPGPRVERRGGRVDPHAQGAAQGRIADVRGPDREHVRRRPGIRRLIRAVPIHRRRPMNTTRLVRALALAALFGPANALAAGYSIDLAWAPGDALSLAAGFNAVYAKVELNNIATFLSDGGQPVNVSRAKLESDFTRGYGWNAAALANPWTNWRLGLSFKSKITVNIDDGRATFTQIPTGDAPLDAAVAASLPANQGVKTQLLFPASLTWGLAWNPQPEWTDEIDGVWTGSSAFEKLPLQFSKDTPLDPGRV